jgi:uncharacterized protein (DUF488 family)
MIFTIGHSVRPLSEFLLLLKAHGVTGLADVRTVPKSRRHPHFAGEALQTSLPAAGIEYRHFPALGGLRKPRRDSPNGAWRHEGFRGYADHMQTEEFRAAVDDLLSFAASRIVAVMSRRRSAPYHVGAGSPRAPTDVVCPCRGRRSDLSGLDMT